MRKIVRTLQGGKPILFRGFGCIFFRRFSCKIQLNPRNPTVVYAIYCAAPPQKTQTFPQRTHNAALPALHKLPALPALPFLPALAYEFRCIGGKLNGQRETGEAMQCLGRDDGANLYLKPSKRTVIRYLMKTNIPLIPYTMTSTSGNLCH